MQNSRKLFGLFSLLLACTGGSMLGYNFSKSSVMRPVTKTDSPTKEPAFSTPHPGQVYYDPYSVFHTTDDHPPLSDLNRIDRAVPSVLSFDEDGVLVGRGTGVVIHPDGYVSTNAHVAGTGSVFEVRLLSDTPEGYTSYRTRSISRSSSKDYAVLKIENSAKPFAYLGVADTRSTPESLICYSYSNDGPYLESGRGKVLDTEIINDTTHYLTSLTITPGHSGGPCLDENLGVVSLNTAVTPYISLPGSNRILPLRVNKKSRVFTLLHRLRLLKTISVSLTH